MSEESSSLNDVDIPNELVMTKKNTIYLSGPVRKVEDNGRGWREEIIEDFGDEFDFINPLDSYDPDTHDILSDPLNFDEDSPKKQVLPSEYVMEDKMGIRESEFLFLGLPEKIARGSMMEAMYSFFYDTPFFVWTMDGQTESGWLFHHSEYMDSDRDAVIDAIRNYE